MHDHFFSIHVKKYSPAHDFSVHCPASLQNPKDGSVMFVMEKFADRAQSLLLVEKCLVFWPEGIPVRRRYKGGTRL